MEISLFEQQNSGSAAAAINPNAGPATQQLLERIKDLPEKEQQEIIARVFNPELTPNDINTIIKSGGEYQFTDINQYLKFREFKAEEEGSWLKDIATGIAAVPTIVSDAVGAAINKPSDTAKKAIPSLIEGLAQNGRDTYGMFWQSNDPSSPFFRFKAAFSKSDDPYLEMQQLNEAIRFQKMSMDLAEGKTTWVMDKDLIDPKVTQLVATLVDPEVFIPFAGPISASMGVARLAGFGDNMTRAAIRAQKIKAGILGGTLKWGVGVPAEFIGNLAQNSIEYGVRKGAGALESLTGIDAEDIVRTGRAAGVATASAHVAGYSLPYAGPLAATHLGGGLLAGFGQAVKETGNQVLRSQGNRGVLGFARQALIDAEQNGIQFSKQGKMFARIIDTFDPAFSYGLEAVEGGITGGLIGGALAYGSQGSDGVGQGVGFGIGAGVVGGVSGRFAGGVAGSLKRLRNDIQAQFSISTLGEIDKLTAIDLDRTRSDPRATTQEVDAINMTAHALASLEGTVHYRAFGGGVDSVREFAAWKQSRDGKGIMMTNSEFSRVEGFFIQRGSDGALYIGVNLDNLYSGKGRKYAKNTVPHELLHSVLMASAVGPHFMAMGRDLLVGVRDENGKIVQEGLIGRREFEEFSEQYRNAEYGKEIWADLPDGEQKKSLMEAWYRNRDLVKSALDKIDGEGPVGTQTKMTTEEVDALNKYTEEFLAYYFSGMFQELKPNFFLKKGELDGMEAVMDFVKDAWKDHWEERVAFHEPRFNFFRERGNAIDAGFEKNGERVRIGALDYFLKDMLKASMDMKSKGFIDFDRLTPETRERFLRAGASSVLYKDPKTGKVRPRTKKEITAANAAKGQAGYKVLEAMDPSLRRSVTGPDGIIRGDFSDAEFDVLVQNGVLTPTEANYGKLFQRTKDDRSLPNVFEYGYLGRSKQIEGGGDNDRVRGSAVPVTQRRVLMADFYMEFGERGEFTMRIRGLDMKVMDRRRSMLWQNPTVRALWNDDHRMFAKDFRAYLSNLSLPHNDPNRLPTAQWLNQRYKDGLGDARRDVLHQIAGFAKGEDLAYANTPVAVIPRGTMMAVTDFTVDSMLNLRTSGENYDYVHANAFYDVARNFKPVAYKPRVGLKDTTSYVNDFGYELVKSKGLFKAFSPTGQHIITSENMKKALEASSEHFDKAIINEERKALEEHASEVAKFKFRPDAGSIRDVIQGRSKIEEIPEVAALIGNDAEFRQELHAEFHAKHFKEILTRTDAGAQMAIRILNDFKNGAFADIIGESVISDGAGSYFDPKGKDRLFGDADLSSTQSMLKFLNNLFSEQYNVSASYRSIRSTQSKSVSRMFAKALDIYYAKEVLGGNGGKDVVALTLHTPTRRDFVVARAFENRNSSAYPYTYLATGTGHVGYIGKKANLKLLLRDADGETYGQFALVAARMKNPVIVDIDRLTLSLYDTIREVIKSGQWDSFSKQFGGTSRLRPVMTPPSLDKQGRVNITRTDFYTILSNFIKQQYGNRDIIQIQNSPFDGGLATKMPAWNYGSSVSVGLNADSAGDRTVVLGMNFKDDPNLGPLNLRPRVAIEGRIPSEEVSRILDSRQGIEMPITSSRTAVYTSTAIPVVTGTDSKKYQTIRGESEEAFYPSSGKTLLKPKTPDEYYRRSYLEGGIEDGSTVDKIKKDLMMQLTNVMLTSQLQPLANLSDREYNLFKSIAKMLEQDSIDFLNNDKDLTEAEYNLDFARLNLEYAAKKAELHRTRNSLRMEYEYMDNMYQQLNHFSTGGGIKWHINNTDSYSAYGSTKDLVTLADRSVTYQLSKTTDVLQSLVHNKENIANAKRDLADAKKIKDQDEVERLEKIIFKYEKSLIVWERDFAAQKELLLNFVNENKGNFEEFRRKVETDSRGSLTVKLVKRRSFIHDRYGDVPLEEAMNRYFVNALSLSSDDITAVKTELGDVLSHIYDEDIPKATIVRSDSLEELTNQIRSVIRDDAAYVTIRDGVKYIDGAYLPDLTTVLAEHPDLLSRYQDYLAPIKESANALGVNKGPMYRTFDKADDDYLFIDQPSSYTTYLKNRAKDRKNRISLLMKQKVLDLYTAANADPMNYSSDYKGLLGHFVKYDDPLNSMTSALFRVDLQKKIYAELDDIQRSTDDVQTKAKRIEEVLHKRTDVSDELSELLASQTRIRDEHLRDFSELDFKFMFRNVLRDQIVEAFGKNPKGMKAKDVLKLIDQVTSSGIPVKPEADGIGLLKHLNELEVARRGKENERLQLNEVLDYIDKNAFTVWATDKIGVIDLDRGSSGPETASTRQYILGSNTNGLGDVVDYGTNAAFVEGPSGYYPSQFASPHAMPKDRNIVHTRYTIRQNTLGEKVELVEEVQANNSQHDYEKALAAEKQLESLAANGDKIAEQVINLIKEQQKSVTSRDGWKVIRASLAALQTAHANKDTVFNQGIVESGLREILAKGFAPVAGDENPALTKRLGMNFARDYANAGLRLLQSDIEVLNKQYVVQRDIFTLSLSGDGRISGNGIPASYLSDRVVNRLRTDSDSRFADYIDTYKNRLQIGELTESQRRLIVENIREKILTGDLVSSVVDMVRKDLQRYILENRTDFSDYINFSSYVDAASESNLAENSSLAFIQKKVQKAVDRVFELSPNTFYGFTKEQVIQMSMLGLQSADGGGRWYHSKGVSPNNVFGSISNSLIQSVSQRIDMLVAKGETEYAMKNNFGYDMFRGDMDSRKVTINIDGVPVKVMAYSDAATNFSHGHVWQGRSLRERQQDVFMVLENAAEMYSSGFKDSSVYGTTNQAAEYIISALGVFCVSDGNVASNSIDTTGRVADLSVYGDGYIVSQATKIVSTSLRYNPEAFGYSQNNHAFLYKELTSLFENGNYEGVISRFLEGMLGDNWKLNTSVLDGMSKARKTSPSKRDTAGASNKLKEMLTLAGLQPKTINEYMINDDMNARVLTKINSAVARFGDSAGDKDSIMVIKDIIIRDALEYLTGPEYERERKKYMQLLFQPSSEYRLVGYRMALRRAALSGAVRLYLPSADLVGSVSGFPIEKARIQYTKTDPNIVRKEAKRLGLKVYEPEPIATINPDAFATLDKATQSEINGGRQAALDSIKGAKDAYAGVVKGLRLDKGRVVGDYTPEVQAVLDSIRSKLGNESGVKDLIESAFVHADTNDRQNKYVLGKYWFTSEGDGSLKLLEKIIVDAMSNAVNRNRDVDVGINEWLSYFIKPSSGNSKDGLALHYRHSIRALQVLDLYLKTKGIEPVKENNLSNTYQKALISEDNRIYGTYDNLTFDKAVLHTLDNIEVALQDLKTTAEGYNLDSKGQKILDYVVALNKEFISTVLYYQKISTMPKVGEKPMIAPMDWVGSRVLSVDTRDANKSPKFNEEIDKGTFFYKPSIDAAGPRSRAFINEMLGQVGARTGVAGKAVLTASVNTDGARRIIQVSLHNKNGEPVQENVNESVYMAVNNAGSNIATLMPMSSDTGSDYQLTAIDELKMRCYALGINEFEEPVSGQKAPEQRPVPVAKVNIEDKNEMYGKPSVGAKEEVAVKPRNPAMWTSSQMGSGMTLTTADGYFISVMNNKFRLYNVNRELIGIYSSEAEARRKAEAKRKAKKS